MATVTPTLEFHDGTDWRDITGDHIAGSLSWGGGIRGRGPTDRVAIPGQLKVELKNGQSASGGLGYYSPNHANKRTGWAIGARIRVKLVSGADTRYWLYRVKGIKPVPGQYGPRRVEVTAKDYMQELSNQKVSGLSIQTGKRGDELFDLLVDSLPIAPTATDYDTGAFVMPYAFHDERDEDTYCLTVAQKVFQSDLAYGFVDGDATGGETLHYQSHKTRQNISASSGTLSDTMTDLSIAHDDHNIWNKVKVTTYPVNVDTSLSILGRIPEEFPIEPGETKTITIRYIDDDTSRRISGAGLQTPVADTDYKMSSIAGNGGNNLNAFLTITPSAGGNSMSVEVENTGTAKGYVNTLQIRGYKVTTYDKVESHASDSASITAYGEKTLTYNMPYQNSSVFGQSVANELIRRHKDPASDISGVTFVANRTATLMSYALTLGIGSRITVTETVTGVNADFFINGYEYELLAGNVLNTTWLLERAYNTTQYFTIDDAVFGEIDGPYLLAPF